MMIRRGIPASQGVAIARAIVLNAQDQPVARRVVPPALVSRQIQRLEEAVTLTLADIEKDKIHAETTVGMDLARIFDFHQHYLQDPYTLDPIKQMINSEQVTTEYAVYKVLRDQAQTLRKMDSQYFRERDRDIWDIERRMIGHLLGDTAEKLDQLTADSIIIAHDLTPSQTANLDKHRILGFATDLGGKTSHTAILAHAMRIPAVVGLKDITSHVRNGDAVIVDGTRGQIIIEPDADQVFNYRQEQMAFAKMQSQLDELVGFKAETTDGTEIKLWGNIEFPDEIPAAINNGATGIGLYRTEFLFLSTNSLPTEEEQYLAYKQAIEALPAEMSLTIRTLDLGADKLMDSDLTPSDERNPFLGVRSIRLCLQNLPLFKTQLRAIMRASAHGKIRIMFPLISNIMELRQAKMVLNDVIEDLAEQNVPYDEHVPVGIMVEVPSVAIETTKYGSEVDFFSIGTNDLIQYTVAVDRGNERVANLYSAAHPAVLQLIRGVVQSAKRCEVDVSLCGEMAGDPVFVLLLLGIGLRSLSMTPPAIPEVKRLIRHASIKQCERIARKARSLETDRAVLNYLRDETRKLLPDVF